jgi:hypothetical protein
MQFVRGRLAWIAVIWVAAQLSTLAATPVSVTCGWLAGVMAADDCCRDGKYCPLHKAHGQRPPVQRSREGSGCGLRGCTPPAGGQEASSATPAILPDAQPARELVTARFVLHAIAHRVDSRTTPPVSPPPRA